MYDICYREVNVQRQFDDYRYRCAISMAKTIAMAIVSDQCRIKMVV